MNINLKTTQYYFLTCITSDKRRNHMFDQMKGYSITEINPVMNISKVKSGSTGFSRMIDLALRNQDRTKPFQPFILLEDDCSFYRDMPESIEIPKNSDIVYVGLSKCGIHKDTVWANKVYMKNVNQDIVQIFNMLSTHAMMICSASGAQVLQKCLMESYYLDIGYDIPLAQIQSYYNIYALKKPLFYQDRNYGGWEEPTRFELTSVVDEELPEYHRIECVSGITVCNNKMCNKN
jgi:hypothetical protein